MRKTKTVNLTNQLAVELANKLADLEDRRVHDSATRLFIQAARAKISRLKRISRVK